MKPCDCGCKYCCKTDEKLEVDLDEVFYDDDEAGTK